MPVKALFAAWEDRDPQAAMKRIDPSVKSDFTGISFLGQEIDPDSGAPGIQALSRAVRPHQPQPAATAGAGS